jgi:predicted phage terminase large subunit-like protein
MLHPTHTVGYSTHNDDLAHSKSREARDIALRAGMILAKDSTSVHNWRTQQGGGFLAAGKDAGWSGYGVNLFLLDDLVADRSKADSAAEKESIESFFRSTAIQRVQPGGSVIVNMTRWSQNDLISTLVNEGWESVNIPVQNERGEWLWPEFWPIAELEKKKHNTHEYDWSALYMGQPRPKGGALFHAPARYDEAILKTTEYWDKTRRRMFIGVDPAATEKSSADYSAIVVGAFSTRADRLLEMDILDVKCMQLEIPAIVRELITLQKKWNAKIAVESQGQGKGVAQMMRAINRDLQVYEVTTHDKNLAPEMRGDKYTRAMPVAAAWNDGRVRVPLEADWVQMFLGEIETFTGVKDRHDDQVDALAYAWNFATRIMCGRQRATTNVAPGLTWG